MVGYFNIYICNFDQILKRDSTWSSLFPIQVPLKLRKKRIIHELETLAPSGLDKESPSPFYTAYFTFYILLYMYMFRFYVNLHS